MACKMVLLQCVAVCCSVLQCVAECCGVLQCCSMLLCLVFDMNEEFNSHMKNF